MNNTELRDSIAKDFYFNAIIDGMKSGEFNNKFVETVAKGSFNLADSFMEEKLRREGRHYLGKVNDEEKS